MAISLQQLTIYLYSAHRAVIFAIAQLSCCMIHPCGGQTDGQTLSICCRRTLKTEKNSCGIARFPCCSTAFLYNIAQW